MNIFRKVCATFFFAVIFSLSVFSLSSYAQPIQLFLDVPSEAVCSLPADIDILVLNENGEVQKDFAGVYSLEISAQEGGVPDESYTISSRRVKFVKGKASFSVKDSEEETLRLDVALENTALSGQTSLSFLNKDIFPPEIVDLFEEAPGILKLEFNEELEEESAQEVRNYHAVTNKREAYPESIEYHRMYVLLKFEEHFGTDEEGHLELEGIKDLSGNEMPSGTRSPDFEGTCEDACGR